MDWINEGAVSREGLALKDAPVFGTCRLCLQHRELKRGHTLSALIYRWLRRTQRRQNRPFIMLDSVSKKHGPVQDGIRSPLCCWECEQALGVSEREFRTDSLGRTLQATLPAGRYASWLLKFATANAWRVLRYHLDDPKAPWSATMRTDAERTAERWRQFLRGKSPGVGPYRLHRETHSQFCGSRLHRPCGGVGGLRV
jgi:hypothetical protein